MAQQFPRERIRLDVDISAGAGSQALTNQITKSSPKIWKATAKQFELGFFFGEELMDISDILTITITGKLDSIHNGPNLFTETIGTDKINTLLTIDQWNNMASQHAVIEFTAQEMDVEMNNSNTLTLWLIITGTNTDGEPVIFGSSTAQIVETGVTGFTNRPSAIIGGNIISPGSVYSGSGHFTQAVVAGQVYNLALGANDTNITNGTQTVTGGNFYAQGSTVTLNGTNGASITMVLRTALTPTFDELIAILQGYLPIVLAPGAVITLQSPDGTKQRKRGIDNDGNEFSQLVDLSSDPS